MTLLDEQIQQRRANLEALRALGVDIYPRRFDRTHSISQIVAEFEPRTAEALESETPEKEKPAPPSPASSARRTLDQPAPPGPVPGAPGAPSKRT